MKRKFYACFWGCVMAVALLPACGKNEPIAEEKADEIVAEVQTEVTDDTIVQPTPATEPTVIPTPTYEPTPTPEPTVEPTQAAEPTSEQPEESIQADEPINEAPEAVVQPEETPAQPVAVTDVDAISNYAAALGYNVHRYVGRFGDVIFQCSYSKTSSGKIFTSYEAASSDTTDTAFRAVLVTFGTTDFVTIQTEAVTVSNYADFNNPVTPIIPKRDYSGLDAAYKLLEDSRGL